MTTNRTLPYLADCLHKLSGLPAETERLEDLSAQQVRRWPGPRAEPRVSTGRTPMNGAADRAFGSPL